MFAGNRLFDRDDRVGQVRGQSSASRCSDQASGTSLPRKVSRLSAGGWRPARTSRWSSGARKASRRILRSYAVRGASLISGNPLRSLRMNRCAFRRAARARDRSAPASDRPRQPSAARRARAGRYRAGRWCAAASRARWSHRRPVGGNVSRPVTRDRDKKSIDVEPHGLDACERHVAGRLPPFDTRLEQGLDLTRWQPPHGIIPVGLAAPLQRGRDVVPMAPAR